jgi:dihydrofolate reductase
MTRTTLSLIAAVARNGVIGKDNTLLWRLPEDLQFLKRTTLGFPVIMGRKTWDSLPARFRPLPGRENIVVTRNTQWQAEGAVVVHSLQAALAHVGNAPKAFVIGGAELYAAALPLASEMVLTEIDRDFDGDVHFPKWDRQQFREISREPHHAGEPNNFDYAFVTYRRSTGV